MFDYMCNFSSDVFIKEKGGQHVVFTGHYVTCTDNKGEIMTGGAGKKES